MRPSIRLLTRETRAFSGTAFVCSTCKQEVRPVVSSRLAYETRRHVSGDSISERVRRRIWGTDNPPGLKDPYGGPGVFEESFGKKSGGAASSSSQPSEVSGPELQNLDVEDLSEAREYTPATSIEELQPVGHLGKWSDFPPSEADAYTPWVTTKRLMTKGLLQVAAHQVAVEIAMLHALKKPLTSVCKVHEHDKTIFKMIWKCEFQPAASQQWDEALKFADEDAETALRFVFEQIGQQTDGPASAEQQPAAAATEASESEDMEETSFAEEQDQTPEPPGPHFFGHTKPRTRGFLELPLTDPALKFAYLKRLAQVSGHYIPDVVLNSATAVKDIMHYLEEIVKRKPKRIAEILTSSPTLQSLPNVKISTKPQRAMDKDAEVGRKKVIERQLRVKGLLK